LTNEKDPSKVDVSKSVESVNDGLFKIRQCKENQENERMTNGSKGLDDSLEMNPKQFNLFSKKEQRVRKRGAHKQSANSPSNKKKQSVGRNSAIKSSTIRSVNKVSRSGKKANNFSRNAASPCDSTGASITSMSQNKFSRLTN